MSTMPSMGPSSSRVGRGGIPRRPPIPGWTQVCTSLLARAAASLLAILPTPSSAAAAVSARSKMGAVVASKSFSFGDARFHSGSSSRATRAKSMMARLWKSRASSLVGATASRTSIFPASPASVAVPSVISVPFSSAAAGAGTAAFASPRPPPLSLRASAVAAPAFAKRSSRALSTSAASEATSTNPAAAPLASARALRAVELLPSYLTDARAVERYHPTTCPDGALQLSVAENRLAEHPIEELGGTNLVAALNRLQEGGTFTKDMIYYQPTHGTPALRDAMAGYLKRLILNRDDPRQQFDPEGLVCGSGCNAVLENLCACLSDPGDAVLIPAPYYAAFEFDLAARVGLHIVPVNTLDHHSETPPFSPTGANDKHENEAPVPASSYYPNASSLNAAYDHAFADTGRAPRILLLSHPNNPLGICYPPTVMKECVDWCNDRGVHLVSDEIYAGSVYRPERRGGDVEGIEDSGYGETSAPPGGPTFVSAMAVAASSSSPAVGLGLGPYVHLVYALSKDFALSGLRVGVAYSENPEVRMPLQKLNDLCQISSTTQLLVGRMLTATAESVTADGKGSVRGGKDRLFADAFLDECRTNVRDRCDRLQSCLDEIGIPYLPADSGLFVWMDFRRFLPPLDGSGDDDVAGSVDERGNETIESMERRERVLYLSLMKEHGLLFTPGMSMRNERAGYFRCVFTAASDGEFDLGLERLRHFAEVRKVV